MLKVDKSIQILSVNLKNNSTLQMWISVDWEVTIDRAEHLVFSTADKMSKATLVGDDSQKNILYCMKCLFVFLKRVLDQALLKKNSSYEEKEQ